MDDLHYPTLAWVPVGDDAILVGYNAQMHGLTSGAIEEVLGVAASEYVSSAMRANLCYCAQTGQAVICESLCRCGDVNWHGIAFVCPGEDGVIVLSIVPLGQVEVEYMRGLGGVA